MNPRGLDIEQLLDESWGHYILAISRIHELPSAKASS